MNKIIIAVGIATIAVALSGLAEAKGRKGGRAAPIVCLNYAEVATKDGERLGVCKDGEKPRVFESYTLAQIHDQDESERLITVMIGWR